MELFGVPFVPNEAGFSIAMNGQYILDADGAVVPEDDLTKWGLWMEHTNRTVAKTEVNGLLISTVFLGLDHRYPTFIPGRPVIWESMAFNDGESVAMKRCSGTRVDAQAMHEVMVLWAKERNA